MLLTFDAYAGAGVRSLVWCFSRVLGSLTKNQTPGFPGAGPSCRLRMLPPAAAIRVNPVKGYDAAGRLPASLCARRTGSENQTGGVFHNNEGEGVGVARTL